MIPGFRVDADIRKASTPPSEVYTSAAVFEQVRERIFAASWQYAVRESELKTPGQTLPFLLLPGFLDEPLLFTRDFDDALHCLSNVCTHRGNLVCEQGGIEKNLRCRYHGRRFDLQGRLLGMPEFEGVENFPSEADNLPVVPFHKWAGMLFVSLRPAFSFDEAFGPMMQRLHWLDTSGYRFSPEFSKEYLIQANWALYCENYLEGFHIPYVHASLNSVLDYGSYTTETYRYSSLQLGYARDGEPCFSLPESSMDHGKRIGAFYFWIFPNLMFNFYPWGLSVNVVKPMSVSQTRVSFLTFIGDERMFGDGAVAMLDRVEREDEAVVESVQRGVRSRLYHNGRYSPRREQGTHHFHRLLQEFVSS